MAAVTLPPVRPPAAPWRPVNCQGVALILQGGGALGSYQAGVYQALHEAGLEPDWVAGISIGSINGAIIAGNPPERRLERLRVFWETITARDFDIAIDGGDDARKWSNSWSSMVTATLGQPGFFAPHAPNPWFSPRGTKTATSFYDNTPLRETLGRLVDFDLLNAKTVRYAAGAVNVQTGNFAYFDTHAGNLGYQIGDTIGGPITAEHVMASGALPPALPMQRIGADYFWDGGLVSNTPLFHLVDNMDGANLLVFQIDLFSARGALPRDMHDVLARQKDIQYSSRTRMVTDYFVRRFRRDRIMRSLLGKLPDADLDAAERAEKLRLTDLPELTILNMIYQQRAYETQAKDYEFSATSMREHWVCGYDDTRRTLDRTDWLVMPGDAGLVTHDIHRVED